MKLTLALTTLLILSSFRTQSPVMSSESVKYTFSSSMDISMKSYKKNGKLKDETPVKLLLPSDDPLKYFGMEMLSEGTEGTVAVYDYDRQKMISLMDMSGMKQAMVIGMNKKYMQPDEEDYDKSIEFVKTGNTKEIMGYSCMEYKAEVEDGTNYYWVSTTAPMGIIEFFIRAQNQKTKNRIEAVMPAGQILEVVNIDDKGEKFSMEVTSIDQNINKTIDLSNYRVIGKL